VNIKDYEQYVMGRWRPPKHKEEIDYAVLALAGEGGEAADALKKIWRHQDSEHFTMMDAEDKLYDLRSELGDVLYYLVASANILGMTLEDLADLNKRKLDERDGVTAGMFR